MPRGRPPSKGGGGKAKGATQVRGRPKPNSGKCKSAAVALGNLDDDDDKYDLPKERVWIYSANRNDDDNNNDDDDEEEQASYARHLNRRVQRSVVRSLPATYSYFQPAAPPATAGDTIEQNNDNGQHDDVLAKEELKSQQSITTTIISTIDKHQLNYQSVPLPILPKFGTPGNGDEDGSNEKEEDTASYSNFVNANNNYKSGSSRSGGKFEYTLNYGTHVPNKCLISHVGNAAAAVGGGGVEDFGSNMSSSGYALQMPMTMGTVIGYSPPLFSTLVPTLSTGGNDNDGSSNPNGEGDDSEDHHYPAFEFEMERQKEDQALFRILWDGSCEAVGYVEDVTLEELTTSLESSPGNTGTASLTNNNNNNSNSTTTTNPSSRKQQLQLQKQIQHRQLLLHRNLQLHALSIHKHVHATTTRKQLQFEWKMENDILPKLVIYAALELRKEMGQKVRLEILLERNRLRSLAVGGRGRKGGGRRNKTAKDILEEEQQLGGSSFEYYSRHPNQYMPSFTPPPPLPSDDEGDDNDDDDDNEDNGNGGVSMANHHRHNHTSSKTKLTKNELVTYHEKLQNECHFAPSKLAERVKLACSMAFECANKRGLLDEYYLEMGRRKEREKEERVKSFSVNGNGGSGGGGGASSSSRGAIMDVGEIRRSSRARTKVVNYAEESTAARVVEDVLMGHDDGDGSASSLPRKDVSGGATARFLLDLMGWLPKEEEEKEDRSEVVRDGSQGEDEQHDVKMEDADETMGQATGETNNAIEGKKHVQNGSDPEATNASSKECVKSELEDEDAVHEEPSDEEDTEEEEAEVEEGEDPFFEPDHCLIIDQLGRKQRYMSPSEIQAAIVRMIEGEPIETPKSLLDEEQVEEMESHDDEDKIPHQYVTDMVCTTGDKTSDLPQFEPASFARCRFAPHIFIPEPEEPDSDHGDKDDGITEEERESRKLAKAAARAAAKKKKEERRKIRRAAEQKRNGELERAYRARKSYELWRFKSIHGNGCAIWPLWSDRARSLLKDLFVMSRVNSTEALAVQESSKEGTEVQPAGDVPTATLSTEKEGNGAVNATHDDEALARSLAEAEGVGVVQANDSEPLTKRRRTTRRAAGGDEPVFYGGHQSMSRDQLLSTLVRLLRQAKPGSSSIMDLKRLVFADDYDMSRGGAVEWKKLRSAMGHILFRLGNIGRLLVDAEGDAMCWDLLKEGSLVKFTGDIPQIKGEAEPVNTEQLPIADTEQATSTTAMTAVSTVDVHMDKQLNALENYVRRLHFTELTLRSTMMRIIDKGGQSGETLLQISTVAVATAADETKGDADAADWRHFTRKESSKGNGSESDDGSPDSTDNIKWTNSNHSFLGKVIFRPSYSPLRMPEDNETNSSEKCQWYEVVSYTPSVKAVEVVNEQGQEATSPESEIRRNLVVERRMRFRAVPVAPSDCDVPPSESQMDIDDDDADDIDFMLLTEAQVQAGIEAAMIQLKILGCRKSSTSKSGADSLPLGGRQHPLRNKAGSRVMLTPLPGDGDNEKYDVIFGVIAGHDHSTDENNFVKDKLLVLLEDATETENGLDKKSCSLWSTVHLEGTILTDIVPDSPENAPSFCSRYKVDMHEYYQGSEAYNVCESIVAYLKSHPKSGLFMEPVDPVALGIPDYFDVVKKPMDISTLAKNLEEGKYSRIPPKSSDDDDDEDDGYDNPVYKMAYGPFYQDVMLIFDNAILYNNADSWIGVDASLLKKNAIRKIDNAVAKASWQVQKEKNKPSSSSRTKKSIYAEEDSDEEMYEYESDQGDDEDFGRGSRRSKKSRTNYKDTRKGRKEDVCSKAIEKPYMLPDSSSGFGVGGAFPHLKVLSNVDRFSLSQDWACRFIKEVASQDDGEDEEVQEVNPLEDEMLLLMKLQQEETSSIRRSSRDRRAPKTYVDDEESAPTKTSSSQSSTSIDGVEYYLVESEPFQCRDGSSGEKEAMPTSCRTRIGVEGIQEHMHERFYANIYRDVTSSNAALGGNGLGSYLEASFPPYLGRVIPMFSSKPDSDESVVWEIREQYMIPALRWVLRGLVKSGHLEEIDGSLSASASNDTPTPGAAAFGAGIVVPNHEYYYNEKFQPFEVLDEKEILRKRRLETAVDDDSSSDEEVELSAYEKMRAERVARNAERLKALGLT